MTMLRDCRLYQFRVQYDYRLRRGGVLSSEPVHFTEEHSDGPAEVVASSRVLAEAWLMNFHRIKDNLCVEFVQEFEAPFIILEVPY